jgi:hypothetical protein
MADLMREKREALARKLAQQHPQVEEFEAAGGDVEDLSGDVRGAVPEVVASPRGGETIHDALDSSRKAASAARREFDHARESDRSVWAKLYDKEPHLADGTILELLDLQKDGIIKLSPSFEKDIGPWLKSRAERGRTWDESEKSIDALRDLEKFSNEESPFAKRAKKYGKPGEEYREEGGE